MPIRARPLALLALASALFACAGPDPDPARDGGPEARPRWERYIRGDADGRLVIELDYVAGAEPRADATRRLVERLALLLDKPDGIDVVLGDVIPSRGADHAWTFEELSALAGETFDDDSPAGTVSMHVMWLDGHDAGDSDTGATLGLAWAHTHIAMYRDTIEGSCGSAGPLLREQVCASSQYLVWLHEVGHIVGLVDNGLPMVAPHRDAENGAHDTDDECIMYWAMESRRGLDLLRERLLSGATPDFDAACVADVAAVRDR